jgi:hypothetical protein
VGQDWTGRERGSWFIDSRIFTSCSCCGPISSSAGVDFGYRLRFAIVSAQRFSYTALHLAPRMKTFVHASYKGEWALSSVFRRSFSSLDRPTFAVTSFASMHIRYEFVKQALTKSERQKRRTITGRRSHTHTSFNGCLLLISLHVLRTILRPHTLASTTWTVAIVITKLLRHTERIRKTGHPQQMQFLRATAPSMNGAHCTDELTFNEQRVWEKFASFGDCNSLSERISSDGCNPPRCVTPPTNARSPTDSFSRDMATLRIIPTSCTTALYTGPLAKM